MVFALYLIVTQSIAERLLDMTSVHIRNAAFKAVSALEQYCSTLLLKVECSMFFKRSESSLNTFIGAQITTKAHIKRGHCKLYDGQDFCSHWECLRTISTPQQNINSCSHCTGATFETEVNLSSTV